MKHISKIILMLSIIAIGNSYVAVSAKPRFFRSPSIIKTNKVKLSTSDETVSKKETSNSVMPYVMVGVITNENQKVASSPKSEYVKKK